MSTKYQHTGPDRIVSITERALQPSRMEHRLVLHRTERGWMAQFVGDSVVQSLFGTDTIPTAFTSTASPEEVKEKIQALNPEYQVSIA